MLIWRVDEKEDRDAETGEPEIRQVIFATMQQVFNICQQSGYPLPQRPEGVRRETDAALDAWFADTGAAVIHHDGGAFYRPSDDTIRMPRPENFTGTDESDALGHYYATLGHETVHWTGHRSRPGGTSGAASGSGGTST